jgi:hypothetical protein
MVRLRGSNEEPYHQANNPTRPFVWPRTNHRRGGACLGHRSRRKFIMFCCWVGLSILKFWIT